MLCPGFDWYQQGLYLRERGYIPGCSLLPVAAAAILSKVLGPGRAEEQTSQGSCLPCILCIPSPSERSCSYWHYGMERPHICLLLLVLDSKPNFAVTVLLPQSGTLFLFRSMEPVSTRCLRRMCLVSYDLQSPQGLLWKTEKLFLHLPGTRQEHKADWR